MTGRSQGAGGRRVDAGAARSSRGPAGWIAAGALGLALGAADAGPAEGVAPAATPLELTVGVLAGHRQLREFTDAGAQWVRESGSVRGASLDIATRLDAWRVGAGISREAGRLDYRGTTQTGVPATSHTDVAETRLALHARRDLGSASQAFASLGLEHRSLERTILDVGRLSGLDESYRLPIAWLGLGATLPLGPSVSVGLHGELGHTFGARASVAFAGRLDAVRLEPEDGPAMRLTVPVTWRLGPASALRLEASVERIDLGRSPDAVVTRGGRPVGIAYQPELRLERVALTLGWIVAW